MDTRRCIAEMMVMFPLPHVAVDIHCMIILIASIDTRTCGNSDTRAYSLYIMGLLYILQCVGICRWVGAGVKMGVVAWVRVTI